MCTRGSAGVLALVALSACLGAALECDESGRLVSDDCEQMTKELHQRFRRTVVCEGMPASEELRQRGFLNLATKTLKDCKAIVAQLKHVQCDAVDVGRPEQYLAIGVQGNCHNIIKSLSMRGVAGDAEMEAEADDRADAQLADEGTREGEVAAQMEADAPLADDGAIDERAKDDMDASTAQAQDDQLADDGATDGGASAEMEASEAEAQADDQPADEGAADDGAADDGATGRRVTDLADDERPVDADDEPANVRAADRLRGQGGPGAARGPAGGTKPSKIFSAMKEEPHEFPMEHMFAVIGVIAVVLAIGLLLREQILMWYRRCNKEPASFL